MGWTCFTISLVLLVLWFIGRKAQPERKHTAPPSSQPPPRQHVRDGGEVARPGGCTPPGDDVRSLLRSLSQRVERLENHFAGTPLKLQTLSQRVWKLEESPQPVATSVATSDPAIEDAVAALISLGEKRPAAEKLAIKVRQLNPDANANQLIAEMLRMQ